MTYFYIFFFPQKKYLSLKVAGYFELRLIRYKLKIIGIVCKTPTLVVIIITQYFHFVNVFFKKITERSALVGRSVKNQHRAESFSSKEFTARALSAAGFSASLRSSSKGITDFKISVSSRVKYPRFILYSSGT